MPQVGAAVMRAAHGRSGLWVDQFMNVGGEGGTEGNFSCPAASLAVGYSASPWCYGTHFAMDWLDCQGTSGVKCRHGTAVMRSAAILVTVGCEVVNAEYTRQ